MMWKRKKQGQEPPETPPERPEYSSGRREGYSIRKPCDTCFYHVWPVVDRVPTAAECVHRCMIAYNSGTFVPMYAREDMPDGVCGAYRPLVSCTECRFCDGETVLVDGRPGVRCGIGHRCATARPMDASNICDRFEPKEAEE